MRDNWIEQNFFFEKSTKKKKRRILFQKGKLLVGGCSILFLKSGKKKKNEISISARSFFFCTVVESIMRGEVVGMTPRRSRSSTALTHALVVVSEIQFRFIIKSPSQFTIIKGKSNVSCCIFFYLSSLFLSPSTHFETDIYIRIVAFAKYTKRQTRTNEVKFGNKVLVEEI